MEDLRGLFHLVVYGGIRAILHEIRFLSVEIFSAKDLWPKIKYNWYVCSSMVIFYRSCIYVNQEIGSR